MTLRLVPCFSFAISCARVALVYFFAYRRSHIDMEPISAIVGSGVGSVSGERHLRQKEELQNAAVCVEKLFGDSFHG